MFGPGAYRPDPSEGMTAIANLPQPEIVPYSHNDIRPPCPRCGHVAYRDKQSHRTLHDLGYVRSTCLCPIRHKHAYAASLIIPRHYRNSAL